MRTFQVTCFQIFLLSIANAQTAEELTNTTTPTPRRVLRTRTIPLAGRLFLEHSKNRVQEPRTSWQKFAIKKLRT